jgi:hypothetical protein
VPPPYYSWTPTGTWTSCSANCGGSQLELYQCVDANGSTVADAFCSQPVPVVQRACDANPAAVATTVTNTTQEESSSAVSCPKDQVGQTVSDRDVTTTTSYACIDHQVQIANQTVTDGPWKNHSYCRDLTAQRCAGDTLSAKEAHGRMRWLEKCSAHSREVRHFVEALASVEHGGEGIGVEPSAMYPTFMDRKSTPEVGWRAPTSPEAPCALPEKAYVSAVCVSSSVTPDQLIAVQDGASWSYLKISEAEAAKIPVVATLAPDATMQTKKMAPGRVHKWIEDPAPSEHVVFDFHMKSRRVLRVTPSHPLLTAHGAIKPAYNFYPGERLVQVGGLTEEIESIEVAHFYGKVFNVFVDSADAKGNLVVTNGYLNATPAYQDQDRSTMNRAILRHNLIQGVFEP